QIAGIRKCLQHRLDQRDRKYSRVRSGGTQPALVAHDPEHAVRNAVALDRVAISGLAMDRAVSPAQPAAVTDVIAFANLPRVARDRSVDPDSSGPGKSVSLTTYIDMVEALGARIANDP